MTNPVTYTAATTAHFKTATGHTLLDLPAVTTLEIFEQGATTDFATAGFTTLTTFKITGADLGDDASISTVNNTIDITNAATLATVEIKGGDFGTVDIEGTAALANLSTAGEITSFTVSGTTALTAATIGHDHVSGSDAAALTIANNAKLASLAPSALTYIGNIFVVGNAELASLDFSSMDTIPLAGAYNIDISNNKLTGTYVAATAGSTTNCVC